MAVATPTWIAQQAGADLALTVVVEGTALARTTTNDLTGMNAAWSGEDWAGLIKGGMHVIGEIGAEVEPFHPRIEPDTLQVVLSDQDGTLAALLVEGVVADDTVTTRLTTAIGASETAFDVLDTADFPASGTIYIGREAMDYTTKVAASFSGITRGKWAIGETGSGAPFAYHHRISELTEYAPEVTTRPQTWIGRLVAVYLHHREAGAWSTRANAQRLWVGRITGISQRGDGTWAINCLSILADLTKVVPATSYEAHLEGGLWMLDKFSAFRIYEVTDAVQDKAENFTLLDQNMTAEQVVDALQDQMDTWNAANELHEEWTISIGSGIASTGQCVITGKKVSGGDIAAGTEFVIDLHPFVWALLGFDHAEGVYTHVIDGTTYTLQRKRLVAIDNVNLRLVSENPAAYSVIPVDQDHGVHIKVGTSGDGGPWSQGDYAAQPTMPPSDVIGPVGLATGFLMAGSSAVLAVSAESTSEFRVWGAVTEFFVENDLGVSDPVQRAIITRHGKPVKVRQVWYEKTNLKEIVLRHLLSTGTAAFNHADYDVISGGMALGIPASLVDAGSFEILTPKNISSWFDKPKPFKESLEPWLALHNAFVVQKNGKITCRQFRFDSASVGAAWTLDDSNKADPKDRPTVHRGTDGLINQVELKYGGTAGGDPKHTITVRDASSISRFGRAKTLSVTSPGVAEADLTDDIVDVFKDTAADAIALFGKALVTASRTFSYRLFGDNRGGIAPGDTALLSDSYIADPRSGTYGLTDEPCWVKSAKFNLETGKGRVAVVFLPETPPDKIGAWSPAARLDMTNDGFVVDGSEFYIEVEAHEFTDATTQDPDATFFHEDELCRIREVSPAAVGAPLVHDVTVVSVDTASSPHRVYIEEDLSGTWDATKQYILESREFAEVVQDQKANAYLADEATAEVASGISPYLWGSPATPDGPLGIAYDHRVIRHPTVTHVAAGYPQTVGDWVYGVLSLNTLLAFVTRTAPQNQWLDTPKSVRGTDYTLVYGPEPIPVFGKERNLLIRLHGKSSDAAAVATFRITIAPAPCVGSSFVGVVFPPTKLQVEVTTISTGGEWIAVTTLAPKFYSSLDAFGCPVTYVTVEAKSDDAVEDAVLNAVFVGEDEL